ncbi:hypothetical protein ACGF1Z_00710 [Streptomyces sp. NPDC048018]|uniref:hypothetical protein n=1 Tax=Streptomyces sp. NPDC048018 TaxID=3365499 RepID=UPI00372469AD
MSTVASSPILTTATPAGPEGAGAEVAPGAILGRARTAPDMPTRGIALSARTSLRVLFPPAPVHGREGLIHYCRVLDTRRRTGTCGETPYGRLGSYVRLQCRAAFGHFLRGLAYGSGLSLAGAIACAVRRLW